MGGTCFTVFEINCIRGFETDTVLRSKLMSAYFTAGKRKGIFLEEKAHRRIEMKVKERNS
jgi:hypothetical protein